MRGGSIEMINCLKEDKKLCLDEAQNYNYRTGCYTDE